MWAPCRRGCLPARRCRPWCRRWRSTSRSRSWACTSGSWSGRCSPSAPRRWCAGCPSSGSRSWSPAVEIYHNFNFPSWIWAAKEKTVLICLMKGNNKFYLEMCHLVPKFWGFNKELLKLKVGKLLCHASEGRTFGNSRLSASHNTPATPEYRLNRQATTSVCK